MMTIEVDLIPGHCLFNLFSFFPFPEKDYLFVHQKNVD